MASVNQLATEVVTFVVEGLETVLAGINSVGTAIGRVGGFAVASGSAMAGFARGIASALRAPSAMLNDLYVTARRAHRVFEQLAVVARRIVLGGAIGIGGALFGSMRGTQEGEKFGQALEYLTRVVGDAFAPYVRMATAALIELAAWFRTLDDDTKDSIARWSLLVAGFAAAVTILPVIASGIAGVAGTLALLTSPVVLAITAFAALTAAAARMFGFFQEGGADAADSLNQSNQSWVLSLIRGIQSATVAISRLFNWVLAQAAKVSDWIADVMAQAGEATGLLPGGTVKELRAMPAIQAPQIDIEAVNGFFENVKRNAKAAVVGFDDLLNQLQKAGGLFDRLRAKANFGQGFHLKMDVQLESLQGTADRLLKALASQGQTGIDQAQLGQLQEINDGIQKVADKLPLVR